MRRLLDHQLHKKTAFHITDRTLSDISYEVLRLRAHREQRPFDAAIAPKKLHLGCGSKKFPGWLNVDLQHSDFDVDLASGKLPWPDGHFDTVVSEHFIEHLDLFTETLPLLKEIFRVTSPECVLWFSCPDMKQVLEAYFQDKCAEIQESKKRIPHYERELPDGIPPQHVINHIFRQWGAHQYMFDHDLIAWSFQSVGFGDVVQVGIGDVLQENPDLWLRASDARYTLFVRVTKPPVEIPGESDFDKALRSAQAALKVLGTGKLRRRERPLR